MSDDVRALAVEIIEKLWHGLGVPADTRAIATDAIEARLRTIRLAVLGEVVELIISGCPPREHELAYALRLGEKLKEMVYAERLAMGAAGTS